MAHSLASQNAHAVVLGGGMAGLVAARVLADRFARVTLVERDEFPGEPAYRKGIPQSRHIHQLLVGGKRLLDELFPGFEAELLARGAYRIDWPGDVATFGAGGAGLRFTSGRATCFCSRELFETQVRGRLADYPQVVLRTATEAVALAANAGGQRVTGVRLRARGGAAAEEDLPADFVVDATGRNSRAAQWLQDLGYPAPAETRINSFLGYASRVYARPDGFPADWKAILMSSDPPRNPRGGALFPLEDHRWIVTLAGAAREYPPTDDAGFLEFMRCMPHPALYEFVQGLEPLSPIYGYQRTENRQLHYEDLPRWPERFVVLGDAVCAFNPVYGQGMTAGARGAAVLGECLRDAQGLDGVARRFQRELARANRPLWLMATGADFAYPTTEGGRRSPLDRITQLYMNRVLLASARDPEAYVALVDVLHLLRPLPSLFRPGLVARVLKHRARGG